MKSLPFFIVAQVDKEVAQVDKEVAREAVVLVVVIDVPIVKVAWIRIERRYLRIRPLDKA